MSSTTLAVIAIVLAVSSLCLNLYIFYSLDEEGKK